MKGIILAGGNGSRLYPITKSVSKQLLPVYDKPMIYYPLAVLMQAGIREVLIISSEEALPCFRKLLGHGHDLGLDISYQVQEAPRGIAEAFLLGEKFIGQDSVCLILGDNIFFGSGLDLRLRSAVTRHEGATIFGYYVKDPERYGIIEFDELGQAVALAEKPHVPKSNWAVTGLYFYDNDVVRVAKALKPSARGELEITDVNNVYLKNGRLKVELLEQGYAWLDTGTHEALIEASMFIKTIEDRQGLKVGCIEEWAYRLGYINASQVERAADSLPSSYGNYLRQFLARAAGLKAGERVRNNKHA